MITVKHFRLKTLNASIDVYAIFGRAGELRREEAASSVQYDSPALSSQVKIESKIKIFFGGL
jgi:hypothetical protein